MEAGDMRRRRSTNTRNDNNVANHREKGNTTQSQQRHTQRRVHSKINKAERRRIGRDVTAYLDVQESKRERGTEVRDKREREAWAKDKVMSHDELAIFSLFSIAFSSTLLLFLLKQLRRTYPTPQAWNHSMTHHVQY